MDWAMKFLPVGYRETERMIQEKGSRRNVHKVPVMLKYVISLLRLSYVKEGELKGILQRRNLSNNSTCKFYDAFRYLLVLVLAVFTILNIEEAQGFRFNSWPHGHRITQWNDTILNPRLLEQYATVITEKGAALDNCFGFVDGTVRPISKPGDMQRIVYNGHKRVHALKFQSVAIPNGLIANMFGPVEGRRHDAGMLHDSGLLHNLEAYAYSATGLPMCLYGDPAYPLRVHLQGPFRNPHLTPLMEAYNSSLSSVRVSVEWLFGDIIEYFKFMDFKKNLKIGMSSIGKMYIVCALLQNALSCLYGNNTF
nr:uncharacterized protein LOC131784603 [Pocillopora verrucosa]